MLASDVCISSKLSCLLHISANFLGFTCWNIGQGLDAQKRLRADISPVRFRTSLVNKRFITRSKMFKKNCYAGVRLQKKKKMANKRVILTSDVQQNRR